MMGDPVSLETTLLDQGRTYYGKKTGHNKTNYLKI